MTWIGAHATVVLQSVGAVTNFAGVLLLFRYGMPFRVRAKPSYMVVRLQSSDDQRTDKHYAVCGYLGIAMVVLGTLALIGASWIHPTLQPVPSNAPPPAQV